MRFLTALLILLSLITLVQGYKSIYHFKATVQCNQKKEWCAYLVYFEEDILFKDELHGQVKVCSKERVINVESTGWDDDGEGPLNDWNEPFVRVWHTCHPKSWEKVYDQRLQQVPATEGTFEVPYFMDITNKSGLVVSKFKRIDYPYLNVV